MVKQWVVLFLLALPLSALSGSTLSPTASVDSAANTALSFFNREFSPKLSKSPLEKNNPGEDFAVVSIISMPFTALYSFLGATVVESIRQKNFPPKFSKASKIGAASAALGTSLLIATFSVDWGSGKTHKKKSSELKP